MATLFQRHCNDESLISHLDGELRFYRRAGVRKHLEQCPQCRLRLGEIEAQVLRATRALEEDAFPGPQRIDEARRRFLSRADAIAEEVFRARTRPRRVVAARGLAWAGAGLALLGAFAVWRLARRDARIDAAEAFNRVERAEAEAARVPVHQRFRVVARQLRPEPASRESQLELWSEPERGRFTTRFSDSQGVLRHAVWQPEPGRQYVYHAARAATVVEVSRQQAQARWDAILFREGLTLEDLEAGLLAWLENRPWRPVSVSSGVALLASADGTALSVEEARSEAGQPVLRLRASKSAGRVTVEFTLEVNQRTYAPQLQCIRYESPARVLELRLYSEPAGTATAVSFEPPAALSGATAPGAIPPPPLLRPAPPVTPEPDLALLEVEIYYALHRIRACLGERIEVDRRPDGVFEVRGAVASPEKKEQVIAALAALGGPRLALDVKSAAEMLREIGPESVRLDQPPAPAKSPNRAKAIKSLSRFFRGNETETEEYADRVLSAGEGVMKDAQALRQLAERFGGRTDLDSPQARWLLEVMSYDHLKELEASIAATRQLLRPILGDSAPPNQSASSTEGRWDAELLRVFSQARSLNDRLRRLFTGADTDYAEERFIRELAEAFSPLQSSVQAASDRGLAAHRAVRPQ